MLELRDVLRSGAWLTRERVRLIAIAVLIASAAGFLFLVVTANGLVDVEGRPLGTDFSDVYAAGTYVRDFYGWHYPPFFLFVAGALALMPYGIALAVWQAITLALYLLVMRAMVEIASPEKGKSAPGRGRDRGFNNDPHPTAFSRRPPPFRGEMYGATGSFSQSLSRRC